MRTLAAIALLLLVHPVFGEVSDKAASQLQLWSQGVVIGGVALVAGLFRPLLGIIIGAPLAFVFAYGAFETFADPHYGAALLAEQGEMYRISTYGSSALMALGAAIGVALGLRSRTFLGERRNAK